MSKLNPISQARIESSFKYWEVDKDFYDPIINYLAYGFNPGGFFTAMLANDYMGAISRSHPANTVTALKKLADWIVNEMPKESWGSYERLDAWIKLTEEDRRMLLAEYKLIYTPREETWLAISRGTDEQVAVG